MNIDSLKKLFLKGTCIELIEMVGEPKMKKGLKGHVLFVDDMKQVHVQWINGSRLALNPDVDYYVIHKDITKFELVRLDALMSVKLLDQVIYFQDIIFLSEDDFSVFYKSPGYDYLFVKEAFNQVNENVLYVVVASSALKNGVILSTDKMSPIASDMSLDLFKLLNLNELLI